MTTPSHLQILTAGETEDAADFTPFPRLCTELRLLIWNHSLYRHRLFEVTFQSLPRDRDRDQNQKTPATPIIHAWTTLHHPLLQTNSESRGVALAFYRVHIPCQVPRPLSQEDDETVSSMLYFNPESDFLFFSIDPSDTHSYDINSLAMLHNMCVADAKGVGVRNLAMDKVLVLGWAAIEQGGTDSDDLYGVDFKKCLRGLQQIIWLCHKEADDGAKDEDAPPRWRFWWNVLLATWGVEMERMPRERVLRGRHLPEWEQELYRVLREEEAKGQEALNRGE
ncbi:hypothetical protein OQA88_8083 [Cercophora sp. LCS_1]